MGIYYFFAANCNVFLFVSSCSASSNNCVTIKISWITSVGTSNDMWPTKSRTYAFVCRWIIEWKRVYYYSFQIQKKHAVFVRVAKSLIEQLVSSSTDWHAMIETSPIDHPDYLSFAKDMLKVSYIKYCFCMLSTKKLPSLFETRDHLVNMLPNSIQSPEILLF